MAIAALVFWMCTAAAGAYLLATGLRTRAAGQPADPAAAAEVTPAAVAAGPLPAAASHAGAPADVTARPAPGAAPAARPRRDKDRFDPPSLTRAKNEPLPGLRALAEFAHPALAIIGLGIWLAYVMSRDRVFAAVGFGLVLGAICAGLSWAVSNARAARRSAAAGTPRAGTLSFSPRLLIVHAAGAALTLLLVVLITARA